MVSFLDEVVHAAELHTVGCWGVLHVCEHQPLDWWGGTGMAMTQDHQDWPLKAFLVWAHPEAGWQAICEEQESVFQHKPEGGQFWWLKDQSYHQSRPYIGRPAMLEVCPHRICINMSIRVEPSFTGTCVKGIKGSWQPNLMLSDEVCKMICLGSISSRMWVSNVHGQIMANIGVGIHKQCDSPVSISSRDGWWKLLPPCTLQVAHPSCRNVAHVQRLSGLADSLKQVEWSML